MRQCCGAQLCFAVECSYLRRIPIWAESRELWQQYLLMINGPKLAILAVKPATFTVNGFETGEIHRSISAPIANGRDGGSGS